MPVFNGEPYIKESIESVVGQSYTDWELIIVDNCSTDGTVEIIKRYQLLYPNIRLYHTLVNSGGPAVPRNIGVQRSKGKYLAFIDADDVWFTDKLSIQIDYVFKNNIICSLADRIDENGKLIFTNKCGSDYELDICKIITENVVVNSSVVVHKDLFLSVMFDEDNLLNGLEDYNSYMRYLMLYGNGVLISRPLLSYRVLSSSLGSETEGAKRLAKSVYCLVKSSLVAGKYDCLIYGLIARVRSYIKYIFLYRVFFPIFKKIK